MLCALAAMVVGLSGCAGRVEEKQVETEVTPAEVAHDQKTIDQLRAAGSDVTKPHEIDFYLYFPTEAEAGEAAATLTGRGYRATVRPGADNKNWLCLASKTMPPTIQNLTEAHGVLKGLAVKYKGDYDGWETAVQP